ncbi:MAG: ABC transporter permease [Eubacteriales bacterium]|jgi:ribose transport system permease protein
MKQKDSKYSFKKFAANNSALVSFLVLLIAAIIVNGTTFLKGSNLINVLRNNSVIGIIALGMTLVIVTGGIDLSVGSELAFMGVVVITVLNSTQSVFVAVIAGIAAALIAGFVTGFLTAKFNIPAFITTLGTTSIYRSVAEFWMNGGGVTTKGDAGTAYIAFANTNVFGVIPMPVVVWIICGVVIYFFTEHTALGRHVYAVGSGETAAKLAGVNVVKVKTIVYMIGSVLVLVGTIVETSRLGSINSASSGTSYEMDAIAAAVIGGTSMAGGRGTVIGTVLGTLTLGIIDNMMNLMGVNPFLVNAVKGAIIIVAVLLQTLLNRNDQ